MKNNTQLFNNAVEYLNALLTEHTKRDELIKYGLDLANYNDINLQVALRALADIITVIYNYDLDKESIIEYMEWWLYEDVQKLIFISDDEEIETIVNVVTASDFIKNMPFFVKEAGHGLKKNEGEKSGE